MTRRIDLNSDLGEGFGVWRLGDDDALLEVVTSANAARGFHAGDRMRYVKPHGALHHACVVDEERAARRRRPGSPAWPRGSSTAATHPTGGWCRGPSRRRS